MRIGLWAFSAVLIVGLAAAATPGQTGKKKKNPHPHHHLHHALWELRDARTELNDAKHDFGGHRKTALVAINDAIKQLDLVLLYKGDNIKGAPTRGDLREVYKQYPHHPHLHHAMHELRHAHTQLKEAKHNFNGHRKAAMRDINIAINEIEVLLKHHKKA